MMLRAVLLLAILFFFFIPTSTINAQVPIEIAPFWGSGEWDWNTTGMIWRDANNDGFIDVFFSNGNDITRSSNTVYLSVTGTLPATATWYSFDEEYSGHCAVGDIDDNGFPDFVVANYLGASGFSSPNSSNMYFNMTGLPNESRDWFTFDLFYSFSCALGDVDNDGDLDLIFATGEGYGGITEPDRIYYNENGHLQTLPGWQTSIPTMSMDVTVGDLDNDGDLELIFGYNDVGIGILYNYSNSIETAPSWRSNQLEPVNTVITGDVNNDGWLDIIAAFNSQLGGNGYFRVYYNDGTGHINPDPGWESATGGYGSAVCLYDYDNDGDDDLAAGRWWDKPRIYKNIAGTFTPTPVWQADFATVVEEIAFIDIDGDGVEIRADTIEQPNAKKLFYTTKHPLQSIDSVFSDGSKLNNSDYCFDLVSGWVSLASAPVNEIIIYFQYSFKNDMTVANWDTSSFAYANTNPPAIDFDADITFGWAPLTVTFHDFTPATNRFWRFGDGGTSTGTNPTHTYTSGGAYDVYLECVKSGGWHNRTQHKMIKVLNDTITFDTVVALTYDTVQIPVYLRNSQPLSHIVLPIVFNGPAELTYVGFDTDSCRTDYFDLVERTNSDPIGKRIIMQLTAHSGSSNTMPLPAGEGKILNLYFATTNSGVTPVDTTSFASLSLNLDADYLEYVPRVRPAEVIVRPCGDIDGNFVGPNIADLTALVAFLFQGGTTPEPLWISNIDGLNDTNVADLTYLVSYLFQGGPVPVCQ